jgi:radical SAM superfamily enzyme YgiQ (UPF0313 family)
MKRVLLVSTNTVTAPYPVPPLGLCLMAEAIAAEQRYEVRLHDGLGDHGARLPEVVADFRPELVGLGIRNLDELVMRQPHSYLPEIIERFVAPLRQLSAAPLVLGGSGYSLFPEAILAATGADYGIVGEGEHSFPALLAALAAGGDPRALAIPGVVVAEHARDVPRGGRAQQPATAAPRPRSVPGSAIASSNIDRWLDYSPYRERGSYPVQTKRGCPHECIYCTYPTLEGAGCRVREPAAIVEEIAQAQQRLGEVGFEIVDSTFNDPPGHAEAICREILRRGLRLRLRTMGVNPRGVTRELVELMRQAGFAQIDCTPDSGSAAVIARLGKNFTLQDLVCAARAVRAAAMPTMWFFLFGGPGETERTFAESMALIDGEIDPQDMVYMAVGLRVYPGTRLQAAAVEQGVLAASDDLLAPRFYVSPELGAERLHQLVEQACGSRPNCVPVWEATPDAALRQRAAELRAAGHGDEPMFRSLLRARRERMGG